MAAQDDAQDSPLLSKRYPLGYDADMRVRWIPVPEDLVRFLFSTCTKNQIAVILALLQARDFNSKRETVYLTDRKLKEQTGLNGRTLGRTLGEAGFTSLVRIFRGTPRSPGQPGCPTCYDLTPLWERLTKWRRARNAAEPVVPKSWTEQQLGQLAASRP